MLLDLAPYAGLIAALAACIALAARLGRLRHELGRARAMRDAAQSTEQTATRLLRLAAHELRGIGMTLHGHADQLADAAPPHAVGLAAASSQILGLADELQDHTMPNLGTQSLREELIDPAEALNAAVAATALSLEPGRRHWRVVAAPGTLLWADRRALRHVLARVLADAARNTRQNDAIDLMVQHAADGLSLVIEDEGSGLATPEPGRTSPGRKTGGDSRGIGLRLALARALMLAHGGRLDVEATAQVGTRVRLTFPTTRLRTSHGTPVGVGVEG